MSSTLHPALAGAWDTGKVYTERMPLRVAALAVVSLLILRSIIYVTGLALKWNDVVGTRWYYVQGLHKKYGPIVRIAPEEVAIADPKVVSKVFGLGTKFRKRQQPGTAFNIFSLSDPKMHRIRQRFYTRAFSDETLKTSTEPTVRELVNMAVSRVKGVARERKDHVAEIVKWCMLFGYDVAFDVIYGTATQEGLIASNKTTDDIIMGLYLQRLNSLMLFCYPLCIIGRWLSPFSAYLRDVFDVMHRYTDLWEEGPRQRELASKTVFVQYTKYSKEKGTFKLNDEVSLNDVEIAHDITTFLGAGGEAVGATLVFLIWQVLKLPHLQRELEAEVAGLTEPLSDAKTSELPILNGVIYEALRMYGGGATHLPRYSPEAFEMNGYVIPPGTAVTVHHGALHRNPEVWDNPEEFDYTRWLAPDVSKSLIQDKFQPFSSGARVCIGIHLVMIEMRLFVATFFRECAGLKLAPSTTDKNMRILDRFHISPRAGHCEVIIPEKAT